MDEFDVVVEEASLFTSQATGAPALRLLLLPQVLYIHEDRVVSQLFSQVSNNHPMAAWKRAELRGAFGMVRTNQPFTERELGTFAGRFLRVSVEEVEFQGMLRLRVASFLRYSGVDENLKYSDNEYMYMMQELLRAEGQRL